LSALRRFFYYWRQYRAFRRLARASRQIVIYAESGQDWHHYAPVIAELTGRHKKIVCYVSSDPNDPGLSQSDPSILAFCVGAGLFRIMFFQMLEADVMLTQMLDLGNLELKRSVHPVHYIYMFHSLISTHMADYANSFDNYESILCAGPHKKAEIRKRESLHGLKPKRLFEHGYHRLEQLMAEGRKAPEIVDRGDIHVLVAPSWGEQTILNLCGKELVAVLLDAGFRLTIRPHFQTRWKTPEVLDGIFASFGDNPRFALVEQMSESDSLYDSHVMITDWSGAGMDYGMGLEKPVLYIDVPPKTRNDTYHELGMEPFESYVRDKIGAILSPDRLAEAPAMILSLLENRGQFSQRVRRLREECVFNLGCSSAAAGRAVVEVADEIANERR
jgi:YidC/Oxa1 family membrane protein insertase